MSMFYRAAQLFLLLPPLFHLFVFRGALLNALFQFFGSLFNWPLDKFCHRRDVCFVCRCTSFFCLPTVNSAGNSSLNTKQLAIYHTNTFEMWAILKATAVRAYRNGKSAAEKTVWIDGPPAYRETQISQSLITYANNVQMRHEPKKQNNNVQQQEPFPPRETEANMNVWRNCERVAKERQKNAEHCLKFGKHARHTSHDFAVRLCLCTLLFFWFNWRSIESFKSHNNVPL